MALPSPEVGLLRLWPRSENPSTSSAPTVCQTLPSLTNPHSTQGRELPLPSPTPSVQVRKPRRWDWEPTRGSAGRWDSPRKLSPHPLSLQALQMPLPSRSSSDIPKQSPPQGPGFASREHCVWNTSAPLTEPQ